MEAVGPDRIKRQYAQSDLWASIEAAIRADSESRGELKVDDLAPLEEFHIGGRHASIELADMAGFSQGDRILDIGAGIGGPARLLASHFGCRVTALDLTEEYCEAARKLTEMVGLADRVTVRQGSALDLPFADAEFDGA
jgi:MPBQ/MSBQ methyltransferase